MAAHFTFQIATLSPILIAFMVRGTLSTSRIGVQSPPIEVHPAEETPEAPALDRIEYDHADKNKSNVYYVQVSGSSVNGSVHNQVIIIDKFVGNLGESSEESVEQMTNVDDHSNAADSKPDGSSNSTTSITTHGTTDGDKGGSHSTGYSNGSTTEIPKEDFTFSINQSSNTNATEGQVKDYQPTTNNYHEATAGALSSLKDLTISTDAAEGTLTDIEQKTSQDTSNLFSTTTNMMRAETHDSINTDLNSSTESLKYIVGEEIAQPIGDFDLLTTQIPSEESTIGGEQTEGNSSTAHASSSYGEAAVVMAEEAPSSNSDSLVSYTDPTSFGEQGNTQATSGLDGPAKLVPEETPPSSSNQSSKTENRTNGGQNYLVNATTQSNNDSEGIIILVPGETPMTFSDSTPYATVGIGEYQFTTESPIHAQPPETTTGVHIYDDQSTTHVAVDFDKSTAVVPADTSRFESIGEHNYGEEDMGDLNGPSISLAGQTSSSSNDVTSYRTNGTGADQTAEQLTTQSSDYSYRASSAESGETQSFTSGTPIHITEGPTYEQHFTTETSLESLEETSSFSIDPSSSSVPSAAPTLPGTPLALNPPIFSGVQTTPKAPVTYHPPHITVFRPLQESGPGIPHLPGNYPYAGSLSPGQRYVPTWIQHSLPAYTSFQQERRYSVQPYNPFWRTAQNNASEERTRTHLE